MKHVLKQSGYKPNVLVGEQDYLFFGGTSYLGLNYHTKYLEIFTEGLKIWGLNNGASRSNNISLNIYPEAEEAIAKEYQNEAALTFSSGWLAAQTAVDVLKENRVLIYVNDAHPALMPNIQNVVTLANAVSRINESDKMQFLLVSNSVNNIYPEIFDFKELENVADDKEIILLLDHSHGFGYLQEKWLANIKSLPKNISIILCGSLAKGLSLDAGVVIGAQNYIDLIKQSKTFNGASPCSPAVLYTYLHSKEIRFLAKEKLQSNLDFLYPKLPRQEFFWVNELPIVLIKDKNTAEKLHNKHIIFTAFPYPNPNSEPLNRLIITASHSEKELDRILYFL